MAKKRRKAYTYQIRETSPYGRGILATVLGIVSLLIFIILLGICAVLKGNGESWTGSVGFSGFVVAFYGMVCGLHSFHEQCRSYVFCKIGTLLCGFMVAVWFLIFCVGLALT